ncbi:hypothetical protein BI375_05935 [Vibrio rotiferianus]|uniref:Dystroglycan-type cadherin-like domain-containing protein n=1 Tax=Vibrio rotiferianus TaxID=190895 RepID=A0ABX3D8B8_9VIBR|nr:hypothetical protein [Vibrio rotiferianus]OHY92998.1 hypothetical protein BI375_05935 [Vibrio rotiferianus]
MKKLILASIVSSVLIGCGGSDGGSSVPVEPETSIPSIPLEPSEPVEPDHPLIPLEPSTPINQAPTIEPIIGLEIKPDEVKQVQIVARDPEGDELRYGVWPGDLGLVNVDSKGLLTISPKIEHIGDHSIEIAVDDGHNQVTFTVEFTVLDEQTTVEKISELTNFPVDTMYELCETKGASCEIKDDEPVVKFPSRTGRDHMIVSLPLSNEVYTYTTLAIMPHGTFKQLVGAHYEVCVEGPYGFICDNEGLRDSGTALFSGETDEVTEEYKTFALWSKFKPKADIMDVMITGETTKLRLVTKTLYSYGGGSSYSGDAPATLHSKYDTPMVEFLVHISRSSY